MLELKSVSWKNFLSYGDYITTLDLDNLGQCLIVGEIEDDESNIKKSNGAGKSTIPNVIQWVLFGRTMHVRSPGNNIVNWFTGKDCWAKLTFKNGDSIIRTRNTEGKNELIYAKDGDEGRFVSDTLSTSANQQKQLNKIFDLDWEIFCGSVFFNQYGKPWMEMADATRKKAIERVLHVDRLTFYAQAAKSKCEALDKGVEKLRLSRDSINDNIERLESEISRIDEASSNFVVNQDKRIAHISKQIEDENIRKQGFVLPDLESLKQKWELIKKVNEKISEMKKERDRKRTELAETQGNKNSIQHRIKNWELKSGKVCSTCEQTINTDFISNKIDPLIKELEEYDTRITVISDEIKKIQTTIDSTETMVKEKTPTMSLGEARSIHEEYNKIDVVIERLKRQIKAIKEEENPHIKSKQDIVKKIDEYKGKQKTSQEELERSELLNRHYNYIYKAYNDRNKIKSYIFKEHIPFINARLKHYLEVFGLDIKIELTDSLGIGSNMWGYEFESGGERKRTDVAFMLAMFDFHEQMYGRQCNILVLDEVDGRMDDDGIDSLINVIKNDLSHRVESILLISHRNMMYDTFPKELRVVRRDRLSYLEGN